MFFLQVGHFFCAFTAALMHGSQKTCLHIQSPHQTQAQLPAGGPASSASYLSHTGGMDTKSAGEACFHTACNAVPPWLSSRWQASSLHSAASGLHLPTPLETSDTAADTHPQGPHAIAFMGSRQIGHCGSGAPPVGCSGAPCCTRAGRCPCCFCFWGCSTSSSASSGECEVRSITASVCCWEACASLHVFHRFRQAAEVRNTLCAEELNQARQCTCKRHPCTHEGRQHRRENSTCRGLLTCCTALLVDALLRPARLSCISSCGLRSCGCKSQSNHICTWEALRQKVETHCSVLLLRSAASSWVPGRALRMSELMAQPVNETMA